MRPKRQRRSGYLAAGCCAVMFAAGGARAADDADDSWPQHFGYGRPASEAEIAAWDIEVRPDGAGLPDGSGTVAEGAPIYAGKCAVCHGKTGVEGPNDRLVARPDEGFPSGDSADSWSSRTIGNYWPYATTVFDYISRSMPQNVPGSLTADEVYALTAYLLWRNGIVPAEATMNAETLADVKMPARNSFVTDDRLDFKEVH